MIGLKDWPTVAIVSVVKYLLTDNFCKFIPLLIYKNENHILLTFVKILVIAYNYQTPEITKGILRENILGSIRYKIKTDLKADHTNNLCSKVTQT